MVAQTQQRLQEQAIILQVTDEARCLLVRQGYDLAYGAQPLRGAVQRMLEDLLAEAILQAAFSPGDTVVVSAANEQLLAQARSIKQVKEAGGLISPS